MKTSLTYSITGAKSVLERVSKLTKHIEAPVEMWEGLARYMTDRTKERLRNGVDVNYRAFKPSIRVQEEGGTTMFDTGKLADSLQFFATTTGCTWGVPASLPYARILNEGGIIRPKNGKALVFKAGNRWITTSKVKIPARKFIGRSKTDENDIREYILRFLSQE